MSAVTPEERLHALDAIRAIALLLGIVLHGTIPYVVSFAEMGWPVVDGAQSIVLQTTFFVIHIFRMSTFFLIAGFFAHLLFHRRGLKAFLSNRKDRVLIPLVLWIGPMLLATLALLTWAIYLNPDSNIVRMESLVKIHDPLMTVPLLAAPLAIMLWMIPDWRWWSGVPTPQYSVDPPLISLSICFYVFAIGWLMHRQGAMLNGRRNPRFLLHKS